MDDYIELIIDVFDETGQHASVKKSLTTTHLIDEILQEYKDLERENLMAYDLYFDDPNQPLERNQSLFGQGVQAGDRLIFGWARTWKRAQRRPVTNPGEVVLMELATQTAFPIEWQPAVIGRPDADHAHNELLVANLEWLPNSRRVSRRHAQISERAGIYYLESLSPRNPTLINSEPLEAGQSSALRPDDRIELGYSGIVLRLVPQ